MKYTIDPERIVFRPVTVTITCETPGELEVLRAKIDQYVPLEYDYTPWAKVATAIRRVQ